MPAGSLVVVGTGIRLASQCTPEARQWIEAADLVLAVSGDPIAQAWLEKLNQNVTSLHDLYGNGRSRAQTYDSMVDRIMEGVRAEQRVCAVFYGHPGIYVYPSHEAIRRARAEGFEAWMLPGVSAEDCLFADLGVDPGQLGCQSYEATDFVLNARKIDTSAALILWQIALTGDLSFKMFESDPKRLQLLADVLMEDYPPFHPVTVYEAATLPVTQPKLEILPLANLAAAKASQQSTLYVPPLTAPKADPTRVALARSRLSEGHT
jgi:uncharacterized protein YabN with tetrapyrrole methylase and pyrophosphatase domain